MGELLLGATRRGCNCQLPPSTEGQQRSHGFPGGEIYLSFAGLGDRLADRVAGEIGDHIDYFTSQKEMKCYVGKVLVTCC